MTALLLLILLPAPEVPAPVAPPGFIFERSSTVETYITAMTEVPGTDRLLLGTAEGNVFSTDPATGLTVALAPLPIYRTPESGILALATHEDFPEDPRLFSYYVGRFEGGEARLAVASIRLDDSATTVTGAWNVLYSTPEETPDNFFHYGGGLVHSGGMLYVGVGDDFISSNSLSLATPRGKILRLIDDGGFPEGNYIYNGEQTPIFATGVRNPFRLAKGRAGDVFIHDVGSAYFEELNVLEPLADYGWPIVEGPAPAAQIAVLGANYRDPVLHYTHGPGPRQGFCIVDGIEWPAEIFPARNAGAMLVGDWNYGIGKLFVIEIDGAGRLARHELFADAERPVTDLALAGGRLWFTTTYLSEIYSGTKRSELWSIRYAPEPGSPAANIDHLLADREIAAPADSNGDGVVDAGDVWRGAP